MTAVRYRCHLRTLFGAGHGLVLAALAGAVLLWPAGAPGEKAIMAWLFRRAELFGAPVLMGMASGLLAVEGRVDERWGAVPGGLARLFWERWLLVLSFFTLGLALLLGLVSWRLGGAFPFWRTLLSSVVTAALFSLLVPLIHARTGSAAAGWAAGMALYLVTVTVSQLWCPADSVYHIWLPFAGLSDAHPRALALSKAAYGLLVLGLLRANLAALARPERLLGPVD